MPALCSRSKAELFSRGFGLERLPAPRLGPKDHAMNLNSPFFDRIRVKPEEQPRQEATGPRCEHPGCPKPGEFRAPKGRMRENEFFCFCLDHVREYNQSYNYFKGMSDDEVAGFQKEAIIGHRPTWTMGARTGDQGAAPGAAPGDPFNRFRRYRQRPGTPPKSTKVGIAQRRALAVLGLDESADAQTIQARYKELVKRLHPDANGGDRSQEEKLREIIHAYKQLRSAKLA